MSRDVATAGSYIEEAPQEYGCLGDRCGLAAVTKTGRWRQMDGLVGDRIMQLLKEESWVMTQSKWASTDQDGNFSN